MKVKQLYQVSGLQPSFLHRLLKNAIHYTKTGNMIKGCLVVGLTPIIFMRNLFLMEIPFLVVFLKDPRPYLREFRRKPRETPIGQVNMRDQDIKLDTFVYQFSEQNLSATSWAKI